MAWRGLYPASDWLGPEFVRTEEERLRMPLDVLKNTGIEESDEQPPEKEERQQETSPKPRP